MLQETRTPGSGVGAEVARPHGRVQVLPERRTAGGDLLHHRADGAAHVDAGALGCRGSGPAPAAEADGASQLVGEELDLALGALGALEVVEAAGLVERVAPVAAAARSTSPSISSSG